LRDQPSDEEDDEEEQQLRYEDRNHAHGIAERRAEVVEHRNSQVGGCRTLWMPIPTRSTPGRHANAHDRWSPWSGRECRSEAEAEAAPATVARVALRAGRAQLAVGGDHGRRRHDVTAHR